MGTLNFDNLHEYAQKLLDRIDPDDLDDDTLDALEDAAAGVLPPAALLANHRAPQPAPPQSRVREDANSWGKHSASLSALDSGPLTHGLQLTPGETIEHDHSGHEQVTHSESGPTSSSSLKKSKKCAAQNKRTGNQCRAWATPSGYCVFHDPDLTEAVNEIRAKGGRAPRRVLIGEARKLNFDSMDRGGIQAVISHVLRLQLLGAMTPRQASTTVKLIGHLVSNAREIANSEDSRESFEQSSRDLVDLTDTVVQHLEGRDLTDRINAIQDVGSKREEILKANDRFGPRPSYRSARDFGY